MTLATTEGDLHFVDPGRRQAGHRTQAAEQGHDPTVLREHGGAQRGDAAPALGGCERGDQPTAHAASLPGVLDEHRQLGASVAVPVRLGDTHDVGADPGYQHPAAL